MIGAVRGHATCLRLTAPVLGTRFSVVRCWGLVGCRRRRGRRDRAPLLPTGTLPRVRSLARAIGAKVLDTGRKRGRPNYQGSARLSPAVQYYRPRYGRSRRDRTIADAPFWVLFPLTNDNPIVPRPGEASPF